MVHHQTETAGRLAANATHVFVALGIVCASFVSAYFTLGWERMLRTEASGPQVASFWIAAYGTAVSAAVAYFHPRVSWLVPAVFSILALRERDVHDWFFEPGLLHIAMLSGDAPLWQKIISGCAMLALTALVLIALFRGLPIVWRGVKNRETWAWVVGLSGFLAFMANNFDGIGRKLRPFGFDLSREVVSAFALAEEILEMCFFFGLIVAIPLFAQRHLT